MERRAAVSGHGQRWQQVARDGLSMEELHEASSLEGDANVISVVVAKKVDRDTGRELEDHGSARSQVEVLNERSELLLVAIAEEAHDMEISREQDVDQLGDKDMRGPPGDR